MSATLQNQREASGRMHKHAVVLVNTLAPRANALDWVKACSAGLGTDVEVSLVRVAGFDAVRQAAADAARANAWLVLSVGGDGTANAVINGVGSHPTRICLLPGGTANDIAYQLGEKPNIKECVASLGTWEEVEIDAMRVNGIRFALGASAGWIGDAAFAFNRLRAKGAFWRKVLTPIGSLVYPLFALWGLRNEASIGGPVKVTYRDEQTLTMKSVEIDIYALFVSGPPEWISGKFKIVPVSDIADGKMEILFVPRTTRGRLLKTLGELGKGTHLKMPEISYLQTTQMELTFGRKMDFGVDGEAIPHSDKYAIDIDPAPIRLLVPKGRRPGSAKLSRLSNG